MKKVYEVQTSAGILFIESQGEDVNIDNCFDGIFKELFTQKECELYMDYIHVLEDDKYLKIGDAFKDENDVIEINMYSVNEVNKSLLEVITLYRNLESNKNKVQYVINNGITKEEADKELRELFDEKETKEINEEPKGDLDTFYKVFGDLFEENKPRSR